MRKLLVRNGWSCQVPARRALERDDGAVAELGEGDLALRGRLAAARGAWLVFEDEAGFSMTPPHAKTWSQRGRTPVVRVRGRSRRRISIAALTCYKPGHRSRLIYRPRRDDGNRDGRKSFSWRDYRDLLIAAHQQLGGPIVLVWDNLNVHKAAGLREFAATRDWLTIYYLPPYAPRPQPRRRCLVPAAARLALQRRFHHPGAPDAAHPTRPPPRPVPQPPHRRLPCRDRTDHQPLIPEDDITSSNSVMPGDL
ncbi:hypothetical protein GCM10020000_83930 [Streptomyces olivoverticillatus]